MYVFIYVSKYARMSALVLHCMQVYTCMSANMYAFI